VPAPQRFLEPLNVVVLELPLIFMALATLVFLNGDILRREPRKCVDADIILRYV
jgi:hypothetical protein